MLKEENIISSIRLSETQKIVLIRIISAANPHVAYENATEGENMVSAINQLQKIGLVQGIESSEVTVTDKGKEIMRNEGLIDESDQLTQEGNGYASKKAAGEEGKGAPPQPTATDPSMSAGGDMGMEMSSFNLISSLNDDLILKEQLNRLSSKK